MPGDGEEDEEETTDLAGNTLPGLQSLFQRYASDWRSVAEHLYDNNFRVRRISAARKQEIADLKAKLPKEGDVVLNKTAQERLAQYEALGTVEDLQKRDERIKKLEQDLSVVQRKEQLEEAAKAAGFKATALSPLVGNLEFSVVEEEVDGTKKPVAYVKEGDKKTLLFEYAKTHWPDLLPALQLGSQQQQGVIWPAQGADDRNGGSTDIAASYVSSTYSIPKRQGE